MRHRQALEDSSSSSPAPCLNEVLHNLTLSLLDRFKNFCLVEGELRRRRSWLRGFRMLKVRDAIAEFRKMVKQIAEFKDSVWTLKEEYN